MSNGKLLSPHTHIITRFHNTLAAMRVFSYSLNKYNGMARHFYLAYIHTHTDTHIYSHYSRDVKK